MYMKDLFRRGVFVVSNSNDSKNYRQDLVGYVAKETEDLVVVFSEFDKRLRFDVPKSEITVTGNSVIIEGTETLQKYTAKRDSPLPQGKSLRPSAEEISGKTIIAARTVLQEEQASEHETKRTTATTHSKTPVHPAIGMETNLIATTTAVSKPFASTQQNSIQNQEPDVSSPQASSEDVTVERTNEVSKGPEAAPSQESEKNHGADEGDQSQVKGRTESHEQAGRAEGEAVFGAESKPALTNETIESSSLRDKKPHQRGVGEYDVSTLVKTSILTDNQDADMAAAQPEQSTVTDLKVDNVYPVATDLTLWQDYILFGIQLYGELTRQFAKINEYWFNTFWSTWREISGVSGQGQKD
jgi:hypothetical protein